MDHDAKGGRQTRYLEAGSAQAGPQLVHRHWMPAAPLPLYAACTSSNVRLDVKGGRQMWCLEPSESPTGPRLVRGRRMLVALLPLSAACTSSNV
jgi:hypothetical protein